MCPTFPQKMEYEGGKSGFTPDQVLSSLNCSIISEGDESLSVHLINEVKKYPVLYDFNHEKYTDKECRAKVWTRISEDLGLSAKEAKRQWKRLRDSFRDALKRQETKTGPGVNCKIQKVWRYQKKMEFVIPFMTIRDAPSSGSKRKRNRNNNAAQNANASAAAASTAAAAGPAAAVDSLLGSAGATALMSKAFLAQSGNGAGFGTMPFNLLAEGTRHGYGPMANPYGRDAHCGPQQRGLNAAIGEGSCYYTNSHDERNGSSGGSSGGSSTTSSTGGGGGGGISFGSAMRYMRVEGFDTSVLEDLITKPLDDELYFCLSLAATMKRLSEQRRAKLKCDVMGLLYNAQYNEAFQ